MGGTDGAEARDRYSSWSRSSRWFLIGIADAVTLDELGTVSRAGDGDRPAGDAMLEGKMRSSRFMESGGGSTLFWSTEFLNCAMPLGAPLDFGRDWVCDLTR